MGARAALVFWVVVVAGCQLSSQAPLDPGGAGGSPGAGGGSAAAGAPGGLGGAPGEPVSRDPACWTGQLPPEVQPRQPQLSVTAACAAGADPLQWRQPAPGTPPVDDARADIVGRWVPCGAASFSPLAHAGVEFGANGRWRLLTTDALNQLVPLENGPEGASGRYYDLGRQLDISGEGYTGGTRIVALWFAAGMDAIRFDDRSVVPADVYARVPPSPFNGDDNLPSISDGRCSMVGTWDLPANSSPPGAPAAALSFDGLGNFVGGPPDSDLCAAHTMYGTYRLSPGLFQLTSNIGMGLCQWWFDAGYPATFDDSCTRLTLMQRFDNCTGGRGYLNGRTTLTRRP